jgi:hypothetical protein
MSKVEYIKNVTVFSTFDRTNGAPGFMTQQLTLMPDFQPDQAIVRAINFNGEPTDANMYLIWSNMTNDYIGSFCGGNISPHFPHSTFHLPSSIPNFLEFKILSPIGNNQVRSVEDLKGDLVIHIDLVKYKKM